MPQDTESYKRKPIAGWVIGVAAILLLVEVREFVINFHLGMMRALDLYPLDSAEMAGYDTARLLMFIIWVGYRLITGKRPD